MIDRIVRLLIALLVLVLIGWGLGILCRSLLTTIDLRAVRAVASERTPAQTTVAHVLSRIGSGYVIFPQMLVCCAILYLGGRSRPSLAVGLSTGGGGDRHLGKLLVARVLVHLCTIWRGRPATVFLRPLGSFGCVAGIGGGALPERCHRRRSARHGLGHCCRPLRRSADYAQHA
jgi:hypothetical protein